MPSPESSQHAGVRTGDGLWCWGGTGPPILLLHGLMGRGRTWRRQAGWLIRYGTVFTMDAAFHRGMAEPNPDPSTDRFVTDVAEALYWIDRGPAVVIGHSMGALHAWTLAARYPELVRALVIEDMSPEFTGRSAAEWGPWMELWPERFTSQEHCVAQFGPAAGRYFWEAFDDGRMHGSVAEFAAIAQTWSDAAGGPAAAWAAWDSVQVPTLLLEAEFSVCAPGIGERMRERFSGARLDYQRLAGAGHLIHDEAPGEYRGAVEAFLAALDPGSGWGAPLRREP